MKALLLFKNNDFPKTHSLRELAFKAGVLEDLKEVIAFIDADYAATRYMDVSGKPPRELYGVKQFKQRLAQAREAMELVKTWMKN